MDMGSKEVSDLVTLEKVQQVIPIFLRQIKSSTSGVKGGYMHEDETGLNVLGLL